MSTSAAAESSNFILFRRSCRVTGDDMALQLLFWVVFSLVMPFYKYWKKKKKITMCSSMYHLQYVDYSALVIFWKTANRGNYFGMSGSNKLVRWISRVGICCKISVFFVLCSCLAFSIVCNPTKTLFQIKSSHIVCHYSPSPLL